MEVFLAGYNVDGDILKEIKSHPDFKNRDDITPETLSASYARISRDPDPINIIRQKARKDVERTKKSNETIIFGLGHSSVAEHAVFNLDIIGVSRLLMEYIEKFRLASYTEKSQRYITIDKDYIVPDEFKDNIKSEFEEFLDYSFASYNEAFETFKDYLIKQNQPKDKKELNLLESYAKEDARYLLSLATKSQLGMTLNARTLEHLISYLSSLPLKEANDLANEIFSKIDGIAPSVIKYYKPNYSTQKIDNNIKDFFSKFDFKNYEKRSRFRSVDLIDYKRDFEDRLFAYILQNYKNIDLKNALYFVKSEFSVKDKVELLKIYLSNLKFYDILPRIFELIDFTFSIVCSSSCYAQLKRHRLATNIFMDYDPKYFTTMPAIFKKTGKVDLFNSVMKKSEDLYYKHGDKKLSSKYILTNAHRRKVIFKTNLRELVHISRLRLDQHAQWDIKDVVGRMKMAIEQQSPLIATLLMGKDHFDDIIPILDKLAK